MPLRKETFPGSCETSDNNSADVYLSSPSRSPPDPPNEKARELSRAFAFH